MRCESPTASRRADARRQPGQDIAVARLAAARDNLAAAIAVGDNLDDAAAELHKLFWNYLPEPCGSASKANLAERVGSW